MDYQLILGTLLLTGFYLMAGFNKLMNFKSTYEGFAEKFANLAPLAPIIIALVVLIEIIGPLAMLYSATQPNTIYPYGKIGSWSLILFTILATLMYHFPPTQKEHRMPFIRNVSLIGAFMIYNSLRI